MGAQQSNRQRHVRVDVIAHIEPGVFTIGIQDADFYHGCLKGGAWMKFR
jgi:hypothetical protein